MQTIKYEDWLKKTDDARKSSAKILSSFDVSKLKRKPKNSDEEKWLSERGLGSKFSPNK